MAKHITKYMNLIFPKTLCVLQNRQLTFRYKEEKETYRPMCFTGVQKWVLKHVTYGIGSIPANLKQ